MTVAEFQVAFPAFADVSATDIKRHLDVATPFLDVDLWGPSYGEGLGNLVAHQIVLELIDKRLLANMLRAATGAGLAVAGQVTSKAVDGVSISFSSTMTNVEALNPFLRTLFGQRFYYLWRLVRGPVAVAV